MYKRSRRDKENILQYLAKSSRKPYENKGESAINNLNSFCDSECPLQITQPKGKNISLASNRNSRQSEYTRTPTTNRDFKAILRSISYTRKREISRNKFTVGKEIGKGNFGSVYVGKLNWLHGKGTKVAIKSIPTSINEKELRDALIEVKVMGDVNPRLNLVSMIGSCTYEAKSKGKIWLILEFCSYGDLKQYLKTNRSKILGGKTDEPINSRCLVRWIYDVANGMEYLAQKQIMHGDLAARNILLDKDPLDSGYPVGKVADFGLSKKFYDNATYEKRSRNYLPWKWMAIEYLTDEYFTLSSDVWSFAVLFWEILAFGKEPYGQQEYNEVVDQLVKGNRLSCPGSIKNITHWPAQDLYKKIAEACFSSTPEGRASFSEIIGIIALYLTAREKEYYSRMVEAYQSTRADNYLKLHEKK